MITINEYLDAVLQDFEEYVDSEDTLCNLLDAHFDGGGFPDYADEHIQQLYLLRYAYGYAFEYKLMYQDLMERIEFDDTIDVTSVGCGSLIDYWALVRTLKKNQQDCDITYQGIDVIDWQYKIQPRKRDTVRFIQKDAVAYFQEEGSLSSDVFIFPKSISEFSSVELNEIANCFFKINKNLICLLFSLRTDDGSMAWDKGNTKIIYDRLLQSGFRTEERSNTHCLIRPERQGEKIRILDSDFEHPGNVVNYLKELHKQCANYDNCAKSAYCKSRLDRWPILNCQQVAYQMFVFER